MNRFDSCRKILITFKNMINVIPFHSKKNVQQDSLMSQSLHRLINHLAGNQGYVTFRADSAC